MNNIKISLADIENINDCIEIRKKAIIFAASKYLSDDDVKKWAYKDMWDKLTGLINENQLWITILNNYPF